MKRVEYNSLWLMAHACFWALKSSTDWFVWANYGVALLAWLVVTLTLGKKEVG